MQGYSVIKKYKKSEKSSKLLFQIIRIHIKNVNKHVFVYVI